MSGHLCISVTFLDTLFHGWGDYDPEWPPSPMRLFQALLAGARTGCHGAGWTATHAEAFRWLAGCQHPVIVAPEARRGARRTFFVPNNDSDKRFDRQDRLTEVDAWPYRIYKGDTVHYLFAIGESNKEVGRSYAEMVCREARHLLALGWGIDQVVGNGRVLSDTEAATLPGRRWRPWVGHRPGAQRWRVPTAASLDDLERVHGSFLQRAADAPYQPPPKVSKFDTVDYFSAATLPPRPYAAFELPDGVTFRQEGVARVAAMLRSLTSRCAKQDTHEFPGGSETYVAGHTDSENGTPPRFSYLPLPTIGHEHGDGMIRRFLVAEPFGGDGRHARWVQTRLTNGILRDQDGNDRGVLLDPSRRGSSRMIQRYIEEARVWSTVTPMVLPGFDDGKLFKAEKLLGAAIAHAGLPTDAIAELAMRKAPFWPGSEHPRHYFVPDYLRHLPRWHVWLRFREAVLGPLAIGGGRHCGLGILATCDGGGTGT